MFNTTSREARSEWGFFKEILLPATLERLAATESQGLVRTAVPLILYWVMNDYLFHACLLKAARPLVSFPQQASFRVSEFFGKAVRKLMLVVVRSILFIMPSNGSVYVEVGSRGIYLAVKFIEAIT